MANENDEYLTIVAYLAHNAKDPVACINLVMGRLTKDFPDAKMSVSGSAYSAASPGTQWTPHENHFRIDSRGVTSAQWPMIDAIGKASANVGYLHVECPRRGAKDKYIDYSFVCSYHNATTIPVDVESARFMLCISTGFLFDRIGESDAVRLATDCLTIIDSIEEVCSGFAEVATWPETWAGAMYDELHMASAMLNRELEQQVWWKAGPRRSEVVRRVFPLNLVSKRILAKLGGPKFLEEYERDGIPPVKQLNNAYTRLLPSGSALIWIWPHLMDFSRKRHSGREPLRIPLTPAAWLYERLRRADALL